jgi:hypothetical protein
MCASIEEVYRFDVDIALMHIRVCLQFTEIAEHYLSGLILDFDSWYLGEISHSYTSTNEWFY